MSQQPGTFEQRDMTRQEEFLELLDPVHDSLNRFVRGMTRDREEARDLVAETLLVAFEGFETLRDRKAFLSFLFTIARRTCRHHQRRRRLFGAYDEQHVTGLPSTTISPETSADVRALYVALEKLSPEQRESVVLFELSGLSLEEIREIQGGTLSGVKARVARGRRKLAKLLGVDQSIHSKRDPAGSPPLGSDSNGGASGLNTLLLVSSGRLHG